MKKCFWPHWLSFVTGTSVFAQQNIGLNAEADYPISPADYGLTF